MIGVHKNSKVIDKVRKDLRREGLTISTACAALAIKIAAALIDFGGFSPRGNILAGTPINTATIGKWGNKLDKQKRLRPLGDYVIVLFTPFALQEIPQQSLQEIAKTIKDDIARIRNDPEYCRNWLMMSEVPVCFECGCSSFQLRRHYRMPLVFERGTYVDHARVKLYVGTMGTSTEVQASIGLPIVGLTEEVVREIIRQQAKKTVLWPLFNRL